MNYWWLVAVGGAAGSLARFALGNAINPALPTPSAPPWSTFPTGTLAVNLIGCALIGLIAGWIGLGPADPHNPWRPLLLAGFLGGFTTFSTFGMETVLMCRRPPRSGGHIRAGEHGTGNYPRRGGLRPHNTGIDQETLNAPQGHRSRHRANCIYP